MYPMNTHHGLHNSITFDEITQKLQRGEIERWFVDPTNQNINDLPNTVISFVTNNGELYLVKAKYDPQINQVYPPVEALKRTIVEPIHVEIPLVPLVVPTSTSLINWRNTHSIFNLGSQSNNITPRIPNQYTDEEINAEISRDYFDSIFQSIDNFAPSDYHYTFRLVPTNLGDESALVKKWSNYGDQIQLWIINDGWAIIYGTNNTFLIVGNNNSHPFIMTPNFSFDNTDGSTDENIDFPSLNLDQVKYLVKTKTIEYIFDQIH